MPESTGSKSYNAGIPGIELQASRNPRDRHSVVRKYKVANAGIPGIEVVQPNPVQRIFEMPSRFCSAGKLGRDTTFKFENFLMRKLGCKLTNPGIPASDFEVRLRSGIPSDPGVFDSDDFLPGVLDFTLYI